MNNLSIEEIFNNYKICNKCKLVKEKINFTTKTRCNECKNPNIAIEEMKLRRKEINKKYYQHKSVECPEMYRLKIK